MIQHDRHLELLHALYVRPEHWPVASSSRIRFELESDRRLLDLCRMTWRRWPLTAFYGRAHHGDKMMLDTAKLLPTVVGQSVGVENALENAFDAWIASVDNPVLLYLRRYDDARLGRTRSTRKPNALEREALKDIDRPDLRLLHIPFDVLPFVQTLMYLQKTHAPDFIIRAEKPSGKPVVLGFYSREGEIFALDVTIIVVQRKD